jgi:hypothetical protein
MIEENTYLKDKYRQLFRNINGPERIKSFKPEGFIKFAKDVGAEVVVIDVKTAHYSLYESKVYLKDPILGERDLVKECIEACRKYGLKFVGYVSPLQFEMWWRKKSKWQQRKVNGRRVTKSCWPWKTWGCWNTGFGEFICSELKNITEKYRPDGFYIDGLIIDEEGCYCEACRKKFKEETGYDIPEKPDWGNYIWYEYIRWRYRQVEYFARIISDAVHSIDPKIELIFNCPHAWCGWYSGQSHLPAKYLDRVGTETYISVSAIKYSQKFWSLITHTSYKVYVTRMLQNGKKSHSYTYITPDVPWAEAITEINTILASGGIPCIQGCPSYLKKIMEEIKRTEPYLIDTEQERFIGLVYSDITRDSYYKENCDKFFSQIHGFFRFCVEKHLPFQLIGDGQIEDGDLSGFKLLILPNVTSLNDNGWENIRRYVKEGGKILATYKTGLYDIYGKIKGNEILWNDSGIEFKKEIYTEKPYWSGRDGSHQDNIPPQFNQYLLLKEKDIKEFNLDFSSSIDGGAWAEFEIPGYINKNLNIPVEALDIKYNRTWKIVLPFIFKERADGNIEKTLGIGKKKYGKGEIYYWNFDIGEVLNKDILNLRNLLYSLILKITGRMPIFVEGPECVFFSLWKMKKGKIYIVHLVNELSPQGRPASREKMRTEIIPVDIKIFIDIPGFKEIRKIVGEGNLEIKNGGREIFIRGMKERVILTIKF